jgi:hypothetical protein
MALSELKTSIPDRERQVILLLMKGSCMAIPGGVQQDSVAPSRLSLDKPTYRIRNRTTATKPRARRTSFTSWKTERELGLLTPHEKENHNIDTNELHNLDK